MISSSSSDLPWPAQDLSPHSAGSLCFDPGLPTRPGLRLRVGSDTVIETPCAAPGIIACPRWIQPTFDALAECAEHGIDVVCLRGNRIGALVRAHAGRITDSQLRRRQFRRHADAAACLSLAARLVIEKTAGQLTLLRRAALQRNDGELTAKAERMSRDRNGLGPHLGLDALRGREGIIARTYFGAWPRLLNLTDFQRIPRRALNPINHLLDLCYSRLCLTVTLELLARGLDLGLGTLHVDDDRRPTLALDLMEPLRPILVDRFVLGCYRDALSGSWLACEQGRWTITSTGRRRWLARWHTWVYGGKKRAGQLQQIRTAIDDYCAWIG
jgi:CRISP-associated protein Cas1